ncbi:MAG: catalase [Clostridia bacterium]|nr:catalase [Clostridia bacterium]
MLKKIWLHFKLITKHKWIVFKLCSSVGMPWRCLIHDLSKYSITEFWESAKFYVGYKSPIQVAREKREYSLAWLHHKGRNKHHEEYWYDWNAPVKAPVIPYKYTVEMLCDNLSAGIVYKGKEFTNDYPLWYWNNKKNKELFHPKMIAFFEDVFTEISKKGIDAVLKKDILKEKYNRYCE